MTPDETMNLITAALRDAIWDTPDASHLEDSPEDVYRDLAARLVLRLSKDRLTVVPVVPSDVARREEIARADGEAAMRVLDIFTGWLTGHPERHFVTGVDRSGKFEIIARTGGQTAGYFRGESVRDAYAQAAQTISMNGGALDDDVRTES